MTLTNLIAGVPSETTVTSCGIDGDADHESRGKRNNPAYPVAVEL
ncbi:MAG: hypothetical protein U5K73_08615 [Halofilum sp. (in: g-proteobacteria)]|nr:hypothetical protein [Halofilum sp. (in: g-proteobacteria)]